MRKEEKMPQNFASRFLLKITFIGLILLLVIPTIHRFDDDIRFANWIFTIEATTLIALIWYTPALLLDPRIFKEKLETTNMANSLEDTKIKVDAEEGVYITE